MKSWSQRLFLVGGLIMALLLAACGNSGPTTSSSGKIQLKIMVGGMSKQIYLPNELTQQ